MTRPLVVTDCDEVLLHMVRHFRAWLDSEHDVEFRLDGDAFVDSMRRRDTGAALSEPEMWELLGGFFDTQMDRQTPIEGALEAMHELRREADLVVLTNLVDERNAARVAQLRGLGLDVPVYTNQGPKGGALKAIVEHYGARRAIFIDDIARHHESAGTHVPHVTRLHFCGEPELAPHVPCAHKAGHAHARIDRWDEALPWIQAQLNGSDA